MWISVFLIYIYILLRNDWYNINIHDININSNYCEILIYQTKALVSEQPVRTPMTLSSDSAHNYFNLTHIIRLNISSLCPILFLSFSHSDTSVLPEGLWMSEYAAGILVFISIGVRVPHHIE